MNSSSLIWRLVSFVSVVITVLLLIGFGYAVKDVLAPSAESSAKYAEPQEGQEAKPSSEVDEQLSIVSIGDSLAKGTGDDTGAGFARRSVTLLGETHKESVKLLNNLGINGLTTEGLLLSLSESGVQHALQQANVILLSIGGNDLFRGVQVGNTEQLPSAEQLNTAVDKASLRLQQAIDKIHEINPQAQLIYIGLYNPFTDLPEMKEIGNDAISTWNARATQSMKPYDQMLVVPTYDLFVQNLDKYLSSDHFHPNGDGYQQIAARITQGLR